jgi:hypothetical protein
MLEKHRAITDVWSNTNQKNRIKLLQIVAVVRVQENRDLRG